MKFSKLFGFAIASVVFFSSCDNEGVCENKVPGSGADAYMSIKLVNSTNIRSNSANNTLEGESDINGLEFYVFNSTGERDTRYGYIAFDQTQSDYTFAVEEGSGKTVLVAANMGLGSLGTSNIDEVKKAIYDTPVATPLEVPTDGIPMSGEYAGLTVSAGTITPVNVIVNRLYARFNAPTTIDNVEIELTQADENELTDWLGGALNGPLTFELNSYIVINGLNQSFVFPNYGVGEQAERWDPQVWTIGNDYDNYFRSTYQNGFLGQVYSGGDFLELDTEVYLYENSPLRVQGNVKGYDARSVYALIIKGTFSDGTNSIERYWRINVSKTADTENVYKILRNAIYNVKIEKIKTLGYGTPEEAEEEKPIIPDVDEAAIEVTVEVADWRVFSEGVTI